MQAWGKGDHVALPVRDRDVGSIAQMVGIAGQSDVAGMVYWFIAWTGEGRDFAGSKL